MIWEFIVCFLLGFLVSVGTSLILGEEKAKKYPGGSMASGLLYAMQSDIGFGYGLFFGLTGWIAFNFLMARY